MGITKDLEGIESLLGKTLAEVQKGQAGANLAVVTKLIEGALNATGKTRAAYIAKKGKTSNKVKWFRGIVKKAPQIGARHMMPDQEISKLLPSVASAPSMAIKELKSEMASMETKIKKIPDKKISAELTKQVKAVQGNLKKVADAQEAKPPDSNALAKVIKERHRAMTIEFGTIFDSMESMAAELDDQWD